MREKCFIDTTVILEVVLQNQVNLLRKLADFVLHTSINVLEEACYKIVSACVLESLGAEKAGIFKIKDVFEKGSADELIEEKLHILNFLKNRLVVLELNESIFDESKKMIKEYHLLPNDALIASTCKHYGIKKIATFDEDFERVDFLEIVRL